MPRAEAPSARARAATRKVTLLYCSRERALKQKSRSPNPTRRVAALSRRQAHAEGRLKQRQQRIEEVQTTGARVGDVAKRMGITPSSAYLLMKAVAPAPSAPVFARVVPARTSSLRVEWRDRQFRWSAASTPSYCVRWWRRRVVSRDRLRPSIYVALEPVDTRMGYERLGGLVRERMRADPRSKALFVFVGKHGHTMKVLTWNGSRGVGEGGS